MVKIDYDEYWDIRCALAYNPNTPKENLEKLIQKTTIGANEMKNEKDEFFLIAHLSLVTAFWILVIIYAYTP